MSSFNIDLLLTINKSHEKYITKINEIFDNQKLTEDISIENAEKLIEYIKEYKYLINSICLLIDKITNFKNYTKINDSIENELMIKMMPIMNIYRTLLLEKYSDKLDLSNNINDQD